MIYVGRKKKSITSAAVGEGIAVQIFDSLSGESVDHRIPPMRVALTAVYNTFQVAIVMNGVVRVYRIQASTVDMYY